MKPVILCDEQGNELGTYGKLEAHQENLLHKAFSILIYNSQGQMLIHQRAEGKYHTPGLWTNACCSHDISGEQVLITAPKRLMQEMGFTTDIKELFTFLYQADFGNGLHEHELDRVFTGIYDGPIDIYNPDEVQSARWVSMGDLVQEIQDDPELFSPWFRMIIARIEKQQ